MLIVVNRPKFVIIDFIFLTVVVIGFVRSESKKYTDEFVLHVQHGEQEARALAIKYHLKFERQVKAIKIILNDND